MIAFKQFILIIILFGVSKNLIYSQTERIKLIHLAKKIDSMVERDQNVQEEILKAIRLKKSSAEIDSISEFADKIYTDNCLESSQIFSTYGYPDFDMVGKSSSYNFWLIVQHCDRMKEFQKEVLDDMKEAVRRNKANPENLAYLEDRVRRNYNKKQIYGTQVYRDTNGIYIPYPISDIKKVNVRRQKLGMSSLKDYLNSMNSQ